MHFSLGCSGTKKAKGRRGERGASTLPPPVSGLSSREGVTLMLADEFGNAHVKGAGQSLDRARPWIALAALNLRDRLKRRHAGFVS